MAEEKKTAAEGSEELSSARKYIATEDCYYDGKYLKRGSIIVSEKKPDHACLAPYSGKETSSDRGYFDPLREEMERRRIQAAMPGFLR